MHKVVLMLLPACLLLAFPCPAGSASAAAPVGTSLARLGLRTSDLGKRCQLFDSVSDGVSELAVVDPAWMSRLRHHGLRHTFVSRFAARDLSGECAFAESLSQGIDEYRTHAGANWAYEFFSRSFRWRVYRFKTGRVVSSPVGERGSLYIGNGGNRNIYTTLFERGRFVVILEMDGSQVTPARAARLGSVLDDRIKRVR